ncbi:DUF4435 domain-containing protein [Planktothrix agardhii 1029]|uniref:Uncharacterized protein n=1 Tax=Planktothrix agardhii (strain NIVA-CYA 126/8) TaxID=388467 RepID=A0A073CBI8_PLAA1|nr:DUF4435 domain-containing protein [Planktothrix agardhii]KEI65287.1 hypothetical protein A19Y_9091 [Planktothrix agardhii NIVA-CYA 126/8]MCB8766630.1 DUF4435 domain-containing protein [Planktothrix agardhii 1809]MCB8780135.1 DUF4435 domain-containing protein [Planktothrix agardhii 1031]MCB8784519.1 DUF4435 domain-containing protein [Planktothrix agardhii 1808]MCF3568831.1 DUF4435 domain-containing protein [Planktothrix agardhii 1807]
MSNSYLPVEYRIYLQNSIRNGNKHILVEGKDDKHLIKKLVQEFLGNDNKILVDSAENLIKGDESIEFFNNRQKVEFIANSICDKQYADGFIGFTDRELHKFEWDCDYISELQDLLNSHDVIQRLILSRGHSIENYIFDLSILCEVLDYLSTTVYANESIDLFKENFIATLRIACSIGLAATKAQILSKTKSTIDYNLLEFSPSTKVVFKFEDWVQKLADRGISIAQQQELRLHYNVYNEQVERASMSIVRWICHGHIGFDFLKALYERCIIEICPTIQGKSKELSEISWVPKEKLFYCFINCWIKKALLNQCEYPRAIFELLGLIS